MLGPNPVSEGTYESDVFDAKIFSRWGRMQFLGNGNVQLFARSGNVDNPDRNWSPWRPVDLQKELPVDAPSARYIQWKAVLRPGNPAPVIDSVTLNYLPKNVAPEVEDVTVSVGARVPAGTPSHANSADSPSYETPTPTVADKNSIAVRWKARDANDDDLVYNVYYRGDGETDGSFCATMSRTATSILRPTYSPMAVTASAWSPPMRLRTHRKRL